MWDGAIPLSNTFPDTLTSDNTKPYSVVERHSNNGSKALMAQRADLLQGTLDLLILKTLSFSRLNP